MRAATLASLVIALLVGSPSVVGASTADRAPHALAGDNPYQCAPGSAESIHGEFGDASAIGWQGNNEAVVACLGGSFYVQNGVNTTFGYGIYNDSKTTWTNVDGYLPALDSTFHRFGLEISITNFGDQVSIGGNPFVAVYSRVAIHNPTRRPIHADPEPSAGLLPLSASSFIISPGATANHDYVVAVDRFGQPSSWPSSEALSAAGGFDLHFAHMRAFWDARLATISQIGIPDRQLADAYRSGFIYTQIARSGDHLNTGVNNYQAEYSHDVIGTLANLFTQGDFSNAQALLLTARAAVGSQGQYEDGLWTYAWPWAIYLLKTGDLGFVRANFSTEGPNGSKTPSIEDTAHLIALDRAPNGIMHRTTDIDFPGSWTIDNYEALMGLTAYRYLAQRIGDAGEAAWATQQYDSLLAATNQTLTATVRKYHLGYLPCSMLDPNSANTCADPRDANWAAPFLFGRWAWDGYLFGAKVFGPGVDLVDSTYANGFRALRGKLPANTFGGYPSAYYYSTGYNAGYGSWGLASTHHRDQGILSYEFMIRNTQSGPYSWWESVSAPNSASPWIGSHPGSGQGSAPHAWGIANANKVLLDSLVVQRSDGSIIIGRGIPNGWVRTGSISVTNFPGRDGRRLGFTLSIHDRAVSLQLTGDDPGGAVLLQLPAFVHNLRRSGATSVDESTGTVTIPPNTPHVTVNLAHHA